jgi:hypothetical protein
MSTTTVAGRATARATAGTFVGVSVSTAAPYGKFSIHDCIDPGQVSALNCIYPQNFAANDSQTGIKVRFGIVVHTQEPAPSASFVVTHSS